MPGGPWPHPNHAAGKHSITDATSRREHSRAHKTAWQAKFLHGIRLFNAGYYWEAHEIWEDLWHVEGRQGPTAEILKGLIKLAAAGVKVREGRENGVRTHCRRAAESFATAARQGGPIQLGLDLEHWVTRARLLAENPPRDPGSSDAAVLRVFAFEIEPDSSTLAAD